MLKSLIISNRLGIKEYLIDDSGFAIRSFFWDIYDGSKEADKRMKNKA